MRASGSERSMPILTIIQTSSPTFPQIPRSAPGCQSSGSWTSSPLSRGATSTSGWRPRSFVEMSGSLTRLTSSSRLIPRSLLSLTMPRASHSPRAPPTACSKCKYLLFCFGIFDHSNLTFLSIVAKSAEEPPSRRPRKTSMSSRREMIWRDSWLSLEGFRRTSVRQKKLLVKTLRQPSSSQPCKRKASSTSTMALMLRITRLGSWLTRHEQLSWLAPAQGSLSAIRTSWLLWSSNCPYALTFFSKLFDWFASVLN